MPQAAPSCEYLEKITEDWAKAEPDTLFFPGTKRILHLL
eukprot:gene4095-14556_t